VIRFRLQRNRTGTALALGDMRRQPVADLVHLCSNSGAEIVITAVMMVDHQRPAVSTLAGWTWDIAPVRLRVISGASLVTT
jgi:hypothetical protein